MRLYYEQQTLSVCLSVCGDKLLDVACEDRTGAGRQRPGGEMSERQRQIKQRANRESEWTKERTKR